MIFGPHPVFFAIFKAIVHFQIDLLKNKNSIYVFIISGTTSEDHIKKPAPYVVMKARQVGSEIKGYDLRSASEDPSTLDAAFLKVSLIKFRQNLFCLNT